MDTGVAVDGAAGDLSTADANFADEGSTDVVTGGDSGEMALPLTDLCERTAFRPYSLALVGVPGGTELEVGATTVTALGEGAPSVFFVPNVAPGVYTVSSAGRVLGHIEVVPRLSDTEVVENVQVMLSQTREGLATLLSGPLDGVTAEERAVLEGYSSEVDTLERELDELPESERFIARAALAEFWAGQEPEIHSVERCSATVERTENLKQLIVYALADGFVGGPLEGLVGASVAYKFVRDFRRSVDELLDVCVEEVIDRFIDDDGISSTRLSVLIGEPSAYRIDVVGRYRSPADTLVDRLHEFADILSTRGSITGRAIALRVGDFLPRSGFVVDDVEASLVELVDIDSDLISAAIDGVSDIDGASDVISVSAETTGELAEELTVPVRIRYGESTAGSYELTVIPVVDCDIACDNVDRVCEGRPNLSPTSECIAICNMVSTQEGRDCVSIATTCEALANCPR